MIKTVKQKILKNKGVMSSMIVLNQKKTRRKIINKLIPLKIILNLNEKKN